MSDLPREVRQMIGRESYAGQADTEVSRANIRALCATVHNANPLFWDEQFARDTAGGPVAPVSMLSTWARPERWDPTETEVLKPLQLHFDLKAMFEFPTAIVGSFESVFHTPVMVGDRLQTCQVLQSVSEEKDTRLGRGRFWVIDMFYRNQRGELVGVESFNCFGYRKVAE